MALNFYIEHKQTTGLKKDKILSLLLENSEKLYGGYRLYKRRVFTLFFGIALLFAKPNFFIVRFNTEQKNQQREVH